MFNVPTFYRVKTSEKKINVEAPRLSLRFGFCNLICGVDHPTPFTYIEPLIVFFFFHFCLFASVRLRPLLCYTERLATA